MNKSLRMMGLTAVTLGLVALGTGCNSAFRNAPQTLPVVSMNLDRADYEVLGDVEETSEVTSYCGLVHIIDNDPSKMIIFGYRTFEDQYEEPVSSFWNDTIGACVRLFSGGSPVQRATYTALTAAEAQGADLVIPKRTQRSTRGFGFFYSVETATVKGKAVRLKADADVAKKETATAL